jgi:hypothetical protein
MKTRMCVIGFPLWQQAKECVKVHHTFPRWNAHVPMKAPVPSPMKLADDREQLLFRQVPLRGQVPRSASRLANQFKIKDHNV